MNATDVLKYGHLWVLKHVDGLDAKQWESQGVCGWWSVKNLLAHLASYEQVLVEVLGQCIDNRPTPVLDQFISMNGNSFNANQVEQRQAKDYQVVLQEYSQINAQVMSLLPRIPAEDLRQPGTIPWYGREYSLEDFMVYAFYGHKREHCAQIAIFRDGIIKSVR